MSVPSLEEVIYSVRSDRVAGRHHEASDAGSLASVLCHLLASASKSKRCDPQLAKDLKAASEMAGALSDQITNSLGEWMERAMPFDAVHAEVVSLAREGAAA